MPKDMIGNELKEGDFVMQFLPLGTNYVIGKIVKISEGGLAVPNGPKGAVTPARMQVMTVSTMGFDPHGGNLMSFQKIVTPPTPGETESVEDALNKAASKIADISSRFDPTKK